MNERPQEFRRSLLAGSGLPGRGTMAMAMAIVALLTAALIGLLVWQNQSARTRALAEARVAVYHESQILAERAATTTDIANLALAQVAEGFGMRPGAAPLDAALAARLLRSVEPWLPAPATLVVHDAEGKRLAAIGAGPAAEDVSDQAFFREHRAGASSEITVQGSPARTRVSRRLVGADGTFAGVASANFDSAAFDIGRDLDATHRLDAAALVLRSGTVITAWPRSVARAVAGSPRLVLLPPFEAFPEQALMASGAETVETETAVVAVAPVRNTPLLAVAAQSTEHVVAQWRSAAWLAFPAIIGLAAAIAVAAIWLNHRHARRQAVAQRTLHVLARAVEDSPVITIITDRAGTIEYANRTFETVLGARRDEVVGTGPSADAAAGEGRAAALLRALWAAVGRGQPWSGVVERRRSDGRETFLSLSVSPIADASGQISRFVGLAEDVTERLENESYRRRVDKAEALGTLVAGIAHEFNNRLTPVLTMTGMAMQAVPPESEARKMLMVALRSAEKARDLVRRFRIFGHDDPGLWHVHDVSTLVRRCVQSAAAIVGEGVVLESDIPDGVGWVRADDAQIEAAVDNLVTNAWQAIVPRRGTIRVTLRRSEAGDGGARRPPWLRHGPHAVIAVTDDGVGMTPDVLERVFDPFFTTREVGQGPGLGLAIVQGVLTTHGGAMSVESQPGVGSTFSLFLPLFGPQPPSEASSPPAFPCGARSA